MSFSDLHAWWAWAMIGSNAFAGVWALAAHRFDHLRRRALWVVVAISQVTVAVQAALGVLAMQVDGREADQLHVIYGFVSLASVGIIYSYRQQLEQKRFLLYGYGCLFLMGLGVRGLFM